jgi:hypothetical protein
LPVTLELSDFTCQNADEDSWYSNGDEPYLFVAAIYADGTTIQLQNLANSTVRIQSPSQTHDNLGRSKVKGNTHFRIPAATGRFSNSILPIEGLPGELGIQKSLVGIVVIAMEEDGSPTSAANAGRQALIDALRNELNIAVRTLHELDVNALKATVESAVRLAFRRETLSSISGILTGIVDPDDYIGADFAVWNYEQIQNAGSAGIPINMTFSKSGVQYSVAGTVKTP